MDDAIITTFFFVTTNNEYIDALQKISAMELPKDFDDYARDYLSEEVFLASEKELEIFKDARSQIRAAKNDTDSLLLVEDYVNGLKLTGRISIPLTDELHKMINWEKRKNEIT